MLASLYPYLYLCMAGSAMVWYLRQEQPLQARTAKVLFWISTLLYFPSVLTADGSMLYKAIIIPRDFLLLAGVSVLTNTLLKRPKALIAFVIMLLAGVRFFYFDTLQNTFVFNEELAQDAELLVDIKSHRQLGRLEEALEPFDATIERAFPSLEHNSYSALDDYYAVDISGSSADQLDEVIEALLATNAIDFIDENEAFVLSPEDREEVEMERSPNEYGLNDPIIGDLWGFKQMKMSEFYTEMRKGKITPKKKARVFILDTGVDGKHEDLSSNYKSANPRYDRDVQGHGTHCAGIAAAVSNNQKGIASLSLNNDFISVTSVKVLSDQGRGSQRSIITGIIKAADEGADVISMSLGGPSFGRRHKAYEEAIAYARKAGAIVVVAAGNSNDNATDYIPASCAGVITVSAVDKDLSRASFSNWVTDVEMGIAAPGVDILSTIPGNKYAKMSGTSMATPQVAGLIGLMKSLSPYLKTEDAYQILKETGIETKDTQKTGMFIQPAKVLDKVK